MKTQIFTIYDSKAEAYLPPFFAQNVAVAQRMFASAAQDPAQKFNTFAADYTLFHLGEFVDDKATFTLRDAPENLGNAVHYLNVDMKASTKASEDALQESLAAPR